MAFELYLIKYGESTSLCYKEDGKYFDLSNPMLSFNDKEDNFAVVEPDESYQKKIYKYRGQSVFIEPALYSDNNWPAILLVDPKDPYEYDCLTVNLENEVACGIPDRTFIDVNNQPKAMDFLQKHGFIKDSGHKRRSGFVMYPLVSVNLPLLYQHNPEVFIDYCLNTLGLSEEKVISDNIDNYLSQNESINNNPKTKGKSL